jgi:hypothetical protein
MGSRAWSRAAKVQSLGNTTKVSTCLHKIEHGVWYSGRFLDNREAPSSLQKEWTTFSCASACNLHPQCLAWTLQLKHGKMCHLLGDRTQRVEEAGHVHGTCDAAALHKKRTHALARHNRVGVATTIKQVPAAQLAWWLNYHMRIGISLFILYCEDAAERIRLQKALRAWRCPNIIWRHSVPDSFEPRFPARQDANINDAIAGCMAVRCDEAVAKHCALQHRAHIGKAANGGVSPDANAPVPVPDKIANEDPSPCEQGPPQRAACPVDWLFHFDVDELLYPRDGRTLLEVVSAVPGSLIHFPVVEVAKSNPAFLTSSSYNFFEHEHYFHRGSRLSYANGKGAGRVTCTNPNVRGWVHRFNLKHEEAHQATTSLALLHYPFCHIDRWRQRYNILSSKHNTDWGFYAQSRNAILNDADGGRAFFLSRAVVNTTSGLVRVDVEKAVAAERATRSADDVRSPLASCPTIEKVAKSDFAFL